jgi:CBS domain-containing protein
MLRSSFPLGRFMHVDLRAHFSFPLLLALSIAFSVMDNGGATRGVALWLALCAAVLVREIARAIAASYAGLRLRALFLLPVGGVMAFSNRDSPVAHSAGLKAGPVDGRIASPDTRWVTASGPAANFLVGLLLLAASYALDPHVALLQQPWISLGHILRSFIWIQLLLGAVSLLPTPTLPSRQLLRLVPTAKSAGNSSQPESNPSRRVTAAGPAFSLGTAIALAMIVAGFILPNHYWLVIAGAFMLLATQISSVQAQAGTEAGSILVHEVMLTEYTLLSSTDTLQGALARTVHSLQDVFPVVRGNQLVGSITRQGIAERLLADGDGYLQGVMRRSLPIAAPAEKLVDVLRRASALGSPDFIPVVDDGALLGILSSQSLGRAIQQVKLTRPAPPQRDHP